jgi:DNA polymerase I-like protein with 3'-5' exonuclease and polymerase domains
MDPSSSTILTPDEVKAVLARSGDLHKATAAKAFGVREEDVTPAQRQWAKTVNFRMLYTEPPKSK